MSVGTSRDAALVFAVVTVLLAGMAMLAGLTDAKALSLVVLAWGCGALWRLGAIDAERFLIDPWWLFLLVGAGALWQAQIVGPDMEQGLFRAFTGAATGSLVGVVPILAAEALGRRWPFWPGDVLLFAALGWLLGPWGVLWALPVGSTFALARHAWVQRRRGRSWLQGYVPLGPGMALGAVTVLVAAALDRVDIGLG